MRKLACQEIREFVSSPLFDEQILLSKDSSWPKISIVTPSYNQAEFIERTILSVLNQNYPNLEFIIIDGGSTDGSQDIIKKYEKYLAYWVSQKDEGQADALKKGFQIASGEIFAWLNSDDTYVPGAFFKVVRAFQENMESDLIFGNIYFTNERDKKTGEFKATKVNLDNFVFEDISLPQQACFWTSEIYDKVGGVNRNYQFCMDFDLFIRIANIGCLIHIPEFLASFRLHKDSKTSVDLNTWHVEHKKIVKGYLPERVRKSYLIYKKYSCHLHRISYYIMQGDPKYILKKCVNRLRGVAFWDEAKL